MAEGYGSTSGFDNGGGWPRSIAHVIFVGKDLTWYAKDSKDDKAEAHALELAKIKEAEADAMAVAL